MKKILLIIGDASETLDTLYPYYRLIEEGYEPVVAAPEKRRYQMVMQRSNRAGRLRRRAGCVKGRRMATVPKCKFDLEVCGEFSSMKRASWMATS